jgi:peptidoglycan hydrolase-like protein with peptidoglycan-binding domain
MRLARLAPLLLLAACFHTHSVEKNDEKADAAPAADASKQPTESEGGAAAKPSEARRPQEPGRPPLSAGPSGLFVPGGVEKVQDALAKKGYLDLDDNAAKKGEIDAKTSAAVRKFQTDQGIARTGNPDHETLRRLGLDPDALMRKAEDVKTQ